MICTKGLDEKRHVGKGSSDKNWNVTKSICGTLWNPTQNTAGMGAGTTDSPGLCSSYVTENLGTGKPLASFLVDLRFKK